MAQLTVPTQPVAGPTPDADTGNSGIIVSAWDPVRGVSLVQYLGLRLDQFLTGGNPEAGLSLDFGQLSQWSSVFGSSDTANIQYTVSAFDFIQDTGFTYQGKRLLTTLVSNSAIRNNALSSAITNGRSFISGGLNSASGCNGVNPCLAAAATDGGYAGQGGFGAKYGGALPISAAAVVGNAMNFYLVAGSSSQSGTTNAVVTPVQNSQNIGQWLLSNTGQLTYSLAAVSSVPLPAAVWLLMSGLAGVGVVGRRRVAA
jgi:hypothetical protein